MTMTMAIGDGDGDDNDDYDDDDNDGRMDAWQDVCGYRCGSREDFDVAHVDVVLVDYDRVAML